ncbi:MAG TPA: bifunctional acetaldehyde-CoA/alcohol dehydrogenase [Thermotogota bacterium]|nr:bifunctional acetaldehyde-CoA/alcohol dehydrogenase [Thermotogota bacterium]HPJ88308.1 bifunctional acetaldehyde-CoA/alcohol dehydrogenase [Thermotogota bacterium]HPR95345.1 bifunctional acetaldehyde-CoA/alcohol dehydrogenase [Thermotogota bacterium]
MLKRISTIEDLDLFLSNARRAQSDYATYSQEKVDEIFRRASMSANSYRIWLAKEAVNETGMGIVEDKVIKNHFSAEYIYNSYKDTKTCGIIEEDDVAGITKVAEPIGIIAGVVPTTNPTSTTIFKALLALKTRNAIIFSPHPRAKKCTAAAARIISEAAVAAGAPEGIVGCISDPSIELTNYLMKHPEINLILATGGPGMVKAAYSSGKPAIGVGAGNTPALIDETADILMAANSILMSKTFDNGVICASEQSIIVVEEVYETVKAELKKRGAYVLSGEEKAQVGENLVKNGAINAAIVGQSAFRIAAMSGVQVPEDAQVLIAECTEVGESEPFSREKLSPTLAMYMAKDFDEGLKRAVSLVKFGGMGHTSVLYTNPENTDRINQYGAAMKTGRILVNMPASQGAIGDLYNFRLEPSLTLGCGSWGGNSVSENVGVKHLMNIKTVAKRQENMLWFRVPPKIYLKPGALEVALKELNDKRRAFVVTDAYLFQNGYADRIVETMKSMNIETEVFYEVEPDPTTKTVHKGLEMMNAFKPDVIIALGGGSPMDAAKIMWLMYEHSEVKFEVLAQRFMDIRKRIFKFPELGKKATMVCVPTTSGTGSEVTPFAVVTDEKTGVKYPIADYELTPDMAIVDPDLVMNMPKGLTANSGIDALVHAIEAYVSVLATDFTYGHSLQAINLIFNYLPRAYKDGSDRRAREKVHFASTIAGMAFGNAFLGICHSMAHKLGSMFHVPHGLANALLISQVIKYNSMEAPRKQTPFPQYKYPHAALRYGRIADHLNLGGTNDDEKVDKLIEAVEALKKELKIPNSIKELGISEEDFYSRLDEMSELAFDDQCTTANPRYPLISEIKELYIKAYEGTL